MDLRQRRSRVVATSPTSSLERLILTPSKVNQVIFRSKTNTGIAIYQDKNLWTRIPASSLHAGGPIVDFSRLQKAVVFDVEYGYNICQVY